MDYELNGVLVCALVDLGATHSFLAVREAQRLNLHLSPAANCVKMVNTTTTTTTSVAKGVFTRVGQWRNQLDFLVIPIDNFGAILGVDFTLKAKVGIFLHYHSLLIYGGDQPYFVQGSPQETP